MNLQELSQYNGRDGQPAYVAVSGTVYDVSASPFWKEGNHLDTHQAGSDLTIELKSAPHVRAVIERFPAVGPLDASEPQKKQGSIPLLSIIIIGFVMLLLAATFML
jgi:predicted heme/steroid binding protein